jgi:hypothetical protein
MTNTNEAARTEALERAGHIWATEADRDLLVRNLRMKEREEFHAKTARLRALRLAKEAAETSVRQSEKSLAIAAADDHADPEFEHEEDDEEGSEF